MPNERDRIPATKVLGGVQITALDRKDEVVGRILDVELERRGVPPELRSTAPDRRALPEGSAVSAGNAAAVAVHAINPGDRPDCRGAGGHHVCGHRGLGHWPSWL